MQKAENINDGIFKLYNKDCLEVMSSLPDNSIDIIIADLPYGRFAHLKWDTPINLEKMWEQIWRICKPNAPVFLFGDMRFSVELINSQLKYFRYEIVWNKMISTSPLLARKRFGKATEYINVFYKHSPVYNYQDFHKVVNQRQAGSGQSGVVGVRRKKRKVTYNTYEPRLPLNIINEKYIYGRNKAIIGITEKPVNVMAKLLNYYSNIGDVCLDMTMGSGSTGVSCAMTNRRFIGVELNPNHYNIAKARIEKEYNL